MGALQGDNRETSWVTAFQQEIYLALERHLDESILMVRFMAMHYISLEKKVLILVVKEKEREMAERHYTREKV